MGAYVLRRLLLMIPTLFGIILLNFLIVQVAPGGPVEQMLAKIQGNEVSATERFSGGGGEDFSMQQDFQHKTAATGGKSKYRGAQGLDPAFIKELERQFGFDKPAGERFMMMIKNYLKFDFGT
ncbi:MAG: microcin ABC transporter permease, partial [Alphaproteobacteria bacterium]